MYGMEGKLNGNHLMLIPGLGLKDRMKLIGEFKMPVGDVVSLVRSGMDCNRMG